MAERWLTGLAGGMPLQAGGGSGPGGGVAPGVLGAAGALRARASAARSNLSPLGGGGQTDFRLALGNAHAGRRRCAAGAALDGVGPA